jgi:hypothetical protein
MEPLGFIRLVFYIQPSKRFFVLSVCNGTVTLLVLFESAFGFIIILKVFLNTVNSQRCAST